MGTPLWLAKTRKSLPGTDWRRILSPCVARLYAVSALVSNEVQFVRGSASSMLSAAAQGAKLKILLLLFAERAPTIFLVSSSIANPRDLRGKKIGVQDFSGLLWSLTMLALREMGLDPQKATSVFRRLATALIAQALATGLIDGVALDKLQSVRLQGLGVKVFLDLSRIVFLPAPTWARKLSSKKIRNRWKTLSRR